MEKHQMSSINIGENSEFYSHLLARYAKLRGVTVRSAHQICS